MPKKDVTEDTKYLEHFVKIVTGGKSEELATLSPDQLKLGHRYMAAMEDTKKFVAQAEQLEKEARERMAAVQELQAMIQTSAGKAAGLLDAVLVLRTDKSQTKGE